VAGLLWAGSGALFARIVAASAQMVAIYAGFAIFLAALIWIYLSWLILLIGAQLSFYVQNPRYLRVGQGHVRLTSALRERLAFTVMLLIARKFVAGESPWQLRALSEDLQIPGSALATVTRSLEHAGLLTLTEDEERATSRASSSRTSCRRCATSGATTPGSCGTRARSPRRTRSRIRWKRACASGSPGRRCESWQRGS
jgi:membrane protein